jgi:hypothetical protein
MPATPANIEFELLRAFMQTGGGTLIAALIAGFVAWRLHSAKVQHEDERERIANARELKLASVLVSDRLAIFVQGCHEVATDIGCDEWGQPAGGCKEGFEDIHSPTTQEPNWAPSSIAAQWKYFDPGLLDQLFKLSLLVNDANWRISGARVFSDPPDYNEYFQERRLSYANLGLRAITLREQVIASAGLADEGMPERYQDAATSLNSIKANLLEKQLLREARQRLNCPIGSTAKESDTTDTTAIA